MQQEYITIRGVREHNLKNLSLQIPKRKITVFTGVSGSGKSSLVFDTIAAESQRQLNETFTTFVRNRLPRYGQPDIDAIERLSPAIIVDQKRLGGGVRSTVGTITDIYSLMRLLWSRVGKPFVGYSNAFSFNDPQGMCPQCSGLGTVRAINIDQLVDLRLSLNEGAIRFPAFHVGGWMWRTYADSGLFDNDKPLKDYTEKEYNALLHGTDAIVNLPSRGGPVPTRVEGLLSRFERIWLPKDVESLKGQTREAFERVVTQAICPLCHGARLSPAALSCQVNGHTIAECAAMEVDELIEVIQAVDTPAATPVVTALVAQLERLISIGLGYLTMDRPTSTLSGGEAQRVKMVRHLGSSLTDMCYIFDEPSIGLHPHDVTQLVKLLRSLRDKGNTVLVVEHDRDIIEIADHIVDIGPRAGAQGGEIVYQGCFEGLCQTETLTGRALRNELPCKTAFREHTGYIRISHATTHNLRNITVDIPTGVLTVITGVAGSGKSSLVNDVFVAQHPNAIVVDQTAVGVSRRSNPATYTGMMDEIRQLFARTNGVSASLFSSNSQGACENCQGLGIIYTDLAYMDPITSTCEVCGGRRFKNEVLGYRLRGKSINEVLEMTAREALEFFADTKFRRILQAMNEVGLTYLQLGQPLNTLSGGECQRLKLATELHKQGAIYVMDEPTTGLHISDIGYLLEIMERLVNAGNSVIVIEHNLDIIKNADWVIDLGPESGKRGGEVVFEGTPAQLLAAPHSLTGKYLRQAVNRIRR